MRDIVILGHQGVMGLEVFGVLDVFELVNLWALERQGSPAVRLHVATLDGSALELSAGLTVSPCASIRDYEARIDTLIVPGGPHAVAASKDLELVRAVKEAAESAHRVVGLCTGAFILAAAGLLDKRKATTHWNYLDELACAYPSVNVDTGPIFIREDEVWTSAGVMATFDLLLAIVEYDLGPSVARFVAQSLVLFLRRTGNQAQFSTQLLTQLADHHPIRELQQLIADHPDADLDLPSLAARVHMSSRHFSRLFKSQTGLSPARYVERVRIETARRRLEESHLSVEAVASACGFGSTETLRRRFLQCFGVSPAEYRRRFGLTPQTVCSELASW
jgi:transcriptional regulator GlxA family with amidase domain